MILNYWESKKVPVLVTAGYYFRADACHIYLNGRLLHLNAICRVLDLQIEAVNLYLLHRSLYGGHAMTILPT